MGIIYVPFALIFLKILCEFRPLPTFIFATLCLLLLEQLSHLLWHPNLFLHFLLSVCVCLFVVCVCLCVCVCCQLCLVAALIVFVRCPRLLHCNDPPPSLSPLFCSGVCSLFLLLLLLLNTDPVEFSLFLSRTLSNSHFEVAKQTKSTVANLRARPEGECGIEREKETQRAPGERKVAVVWQTDAGGAVDVSTSLLSLSCLLEL